MNTLNSLINLNNLKLQRVLQSLDDSLSAFSTITNIPVTYFDADGHIAWEVNAEKKACISNSEYFDPSSSCHKNLRFAMNTSKQIGDIYIFVCNSGLTNMCYTFIYEDQLIGYFNAGPILMGKNRATEISNFFETVPKDRTDFSKLVNLTEEMKMHSPIEITYLSRLYTNCFSSALSNLQENINASDNLSSQDAGLKIIDFKDSQLQINYPFETEESVAISVKRGNIDECTHLFSEYISDLLVFEGGNTSVLKLRLLTFFAKLVKDDLTLKNDKESITLLDTLNASSTFSEISSTSRQIIEHFAGSYYQNKYSGKSNIIMEAINYIENNYTDEINLNIIAQEIHVNNAYLSTLFKNEMNISIVDYIHDLKLSHAADLLVKTNMSITDIAMSCGYRSPSHFAKLFDQKYKETPRKFRNSQRG